MLYENKNKSLFFSFFILILTIFFNSIVFIPFFYAELISDKTLLPLILISSMLSSMVISILFIYIPAGIEDKKNAKQQLFRLGNLNHPLLLRLSTEAPGSYHHSINVSTLSHKAAKSIGANALLVRIGAYYHDIGKIDNPAVYIENQSTGTDKKLSFLQIKKISKVIINHPAIGRKIAEKANLPEEIIQIIVEHHGTTSAKYLYEQAKIKGNVDINDYSYTGPKPQTIESAIVMLADCIEASSKSFKSMDKLQIIDIVDSTIQEKIAEKQFSRIDISPSTYRKIRNSFIDTLCSIYHQRIITETNES